LCHTALKIGDQVPNFRFLKLLTLMFVANFLTNISLAECDRNKQQQAIMDLGARVRITFDSNHIPSWITGEIASRANEDPVESAISTLRAISGVFCASADDDFAFTGRMEKRDQLGQTHVRIKQTYKGLDAVGTELIVHMTDQTVIIIQGGFKSGIDISTEPVLTPQQASLLALKHVKEIGGSRAEPKDISALVVFVNDRYDAYLAYPVKISYWRDTGGFYEKGPHFDEFFVDARTGSILSTQALLIRN
jgi:Zn-dependent metalloprotease